MMSKRRMVGWSAVLLLLIAGLGWAFAPRPVAVEAANVQSGAFEQSIEEDGRTRVKDRYTVSAPAAARLTRIVLREGDRVRAGDAVAVLLPAMPGMIDARGLREAQARLAAAAAGVERATARLERAAISAQEARLELQRGERLAADGFVSGARLDSVRLAWAAAQREQQAAAADREMAQQERAQALAVLQPVTRAAAGPALTVQSPVDGVVLKVAQPSEATLPVGTALLDVGDPARMEVVAELLTTDAVQAQPGRLAVIERWGGPPVQGRVRRVEPSAFTKVCALGIEEQRVRVLVDLDTPPPAWQPVGDGFRVTVRIVTQSVAQALLVPLGAVFPFGDGGMAVYRIERGRARVQPVEIAGRNGRDAWIASGLEAGQTVILYPPPAVADGRSVTVRKQ